MVQPLDQQSKELFDGQRKASDLVGSPSRTALWFMTWALAIGLHSPISL